MKTKWKPLFMYRPVCENKLNLVYVRYDKKTGLLNFKTQKIASNIAHCDIFKWNLDPEKILQNIVKGGNND